MCRSIFASPTWSVILKLDWIEPSPGSVLDEAEDCPIIGLIHRYYYSNDRKISFQNATNKDGGRSGTRWGETTKLFGLAGTQLK